MNASGTMDYIQSSSKDEHDISIMDELPSSKSDTKEHDNNITKQSLLKLHSQHISKGIHNNDNTSKIVKIFGGIDKILFHYLESENVNLSHNQLKQINHILKSHNSHESSQPIIDVFNINSFSELSTISNKTQLLVYGFVREFESIYNIPETITILFILFYATRFRNKINTKLESFINLGILGVGSFARVSLVKDPETNKTYALKKLRKNVIVESKQQVHIHNELNILAQLNSDFTIKLYATYKDKFNVYFLLEPILGGELFTVLRWNKQFSENTARFYGACVVLALETLHNNNIIYRHLKPENILIDNKGYCRLIDFGFAKEINDTNTICGDGFNLSPEILQGNFQQSTATDWWQFGIFLFEMVTGNPPFDDDENMKMYEKILCVNVEFSDEIKLTNECKIF
eukprot:216519_1